MSRKKLSLKISDNRNSGTKKVTNTIKILSKVIHGHNKGKLVMEMYDNWFMQLQRLAGENLQSLIDKTAILLKGFITKSAIINKDYLNNVQDNYFQKNKKK